MKRLSTMYRVRRIVVRTISTAFKLLMLLFFLFPFYWLITSSFKQYGESIRFPPTMWPHTFTLENYRQILQGMALGSYLRNSVIITVAVVALQLVISVPAAYAFARYDFKGGKLMFALVMAAFMVPTQITFITIYIMMAHVGWLDTLLPQILPFAANAFGIFMLRQNFMQVPEEIVEAARLDNAGEIKIMCHIMLPMARSSIITVSLFSLVSVWNSYFWPLVMTDTDAVRPLTLAIEQLKVLDAGNNWPLLMAGNTLLVLPVLILFLFLSKKIIASMGYRGIK